MTMIAAGALRRLRPSPNNHHRYARP